jgi:hypothetical protein
MDQGGFGTPNRRQMAAQPLLEQVEQGYGQRRTFFMWHWRPLKNTHILPNVLPLLKFDPNKKEDPSPKRDPLLVCRLAITARLRAVDNQAGDR